MYTVRRQYIDCYLSRSLYYNLREKCNSVSLSFYLNLFIDSFPIVLSKVAVLPIRVHAYDTICTPAYTCSRRHQRPAFFYTIKTKTKGNNQKKKVCIGIPTLQLYLLPIYQFYKVLLHTFLTCHLFSIFIVKIDITIHNIFRLKLNESAQLQQ